MQEETGDKRRKLTEILKDCDVWSTNLVGEVKVQM